jgi:hypothetical protein
VSSGVAASTKRGGAEPGKVRGATGVWKWRLKPNYPIIAAWTPTAGGLLFFGDVGGNFHALDSSTGQKLWGQHLDGALGGGVITYMVDGAQKIAVAPGFTHPEWPTIIRTAKSVVLGPTINQRARTDERAVSEHSFEGCSEDRVAHEARACQGCRAGARQRPGGQVEENASPRVHHRGLVTKRSVLDVSSPVAKASAMWLAWWPSVVSGQSR